MDAIRSAKPDQFRAQLDALNAERKAMSAALLEKLDYLNAYRRAYEGDYQSGISLATPLFESAQDPSLRIRAGLLMVNSYAATREFQVGLRVLDRALPLIDSIDDHTLRTAGNLVAALFYNQLGQYALGHHYAQKAASEVAPSRERCFSQHALTEASLHLTNVVVDDGSFSEAITTCVAQDEMVVTNLVRANLARHWAGQGERAKSIELLSRHLDEVESTRYPRLIAEVHALLAEYLLAEGKSEEAQGHARIAIEQSAGIAFSLPLVSAHRVLHEIAQARGDLNAAIEHLRAYAEADKAYLNDVNARELAFQTVKHETFQKTQTIDLLNKQNEVLRLEQEVARQAWRNTRIVAVLLGLLLFSVAFWAVKMRRMQAALKQMAETDALTGVDSRHHFNRTCEKALRACARAGHPVGILVLDLDDFKSVNDRFGHPVGDWVLKQAAAHCIELCGPDDRVGRIGGEEFAVLCPRRDKESTRALADRICERVAAIDTQPTGKTFRVSISIGVATSASAGYSFTSLLAQADEALYRAKRDGRNRVFTYRTGCGLETTRKPAAATAAGASQPEAASPAT
ncbi:MAG: GGDEF domain-containing protein [Xanthomonadaceae bacterium]|nr:GGDEF domain-containing protein [Xanthomonadaceae bacterium]